MKDVSLDEVVYFPSLRTQPAELLGLRELDRARKRRMLPLLTLTPTPRMPALVDFRHAARQAEEVMRSLPYLVDLGRAPSEHAAAWRQLVDPAQGFRLWREFVQDHPGALPVVQAPDGANPRAVAQQAVDIEREFGLVVFRLRGAVPLTSGVELALDQLDAPGRALVVLDFGTERDWLLGCAGNARDLVLRWRARWPELRVVVMGNSFPSAAQAVGRAPTGEFPRSGRLALLERELHRRVGASARVAYGDHGAVHVPSEPGAEWPPGLVRIDYSHQGEWRFERRLRSTVDEAGQEAASAIVSGAPGFGERGLWGEHAIQEAANGRAFARGREEWTAVRVNLHLATQVDEMIEEAAAYTRAPCAAGSPSSC